MKKPKNQTYCFLSTPDGDRLTTPEGGYMLVPCEDTDPPTEPVPVPPGTTLHCLTTRLAQAQDLVVELNKAIEWALAAPEGLDEFVCITAGVDCACEEDETLTQ